MRMILAVWCCGLLAVQLLATLPSFAFSVGVIGVACAALIHPRTRWFTWLVAASLCSIWHAHTALDRRLPESLAGSTLRIVGTVEETPRVTADQVQFALTQVRVIKRPWTERNPRINLSWYQSYTPVIAGMRCTLYVRLKPPRGLRNAAGFDSERWYFANAIDAVGTVVAHPANQCTRDRTPSLARLRSAIAGDIEHAHNASATSSILRALAVGVRAEITDQQWRLLSATGVVHLISVSGLHIGMVAILGYALARRVIGLASIRYPNVPSLGIAAATALFIATGYAALTGFSLPTQRTLIMVAIGLW
ncbi:MAG: ComEC/Rec2 family competence protein, partial [Gammaproteobacteria bacterium]